MTKLERRFVMGSITCVAMVAAWFVLQPQTDRCHVPVFERKIVGMSFVYALKAGEPGQILRVDRDGEPYYAAADCE